MRACSFAASSAALGALVVALALGGLPSRVAAQTAPSTTPVPSAPSGPAKSDDALSPSTLPKARQAVTEEGANRVDALSPDEMRRLDRIRAKAAAVRAKTAPSRTPEPKQAAATHPPTAAPAAATTTTAAAPLAATKTAATKAPAAGTKAPVADINASAARTKTVETPALETPAAAASAKAADRRSRPVRQATRRAHAPARTADIDHRRPSRRAAASPLRRALPEVAERAPRVGDIVPPGVQLLPLPPAAYGPRPYQSFPRDPYDDGPPPRRVFMEPLLAAEARRRPGRLYLPDRLSSSGGCMASACRARTSASPAGR